jgi:hypothetical protein
VYILNGNYDNTDLLNINEYQQGTTGYEVLEIDRNSITLDILYRDEDPWNEEPFADYTKVYLVDNIQKFNYENIDNSTLDVLVTTDTLPLKQKSDKIKVLSVADMFAKAIRKIHDNESISSLFI